MTRNILLSLLLVLSQPLLGQAGSIPGSGPAEKPAQAGPFDASRDVVKDFEAAKAEARKSGRRILLDVGGNWCSWCRLLDRFYGEQKELRDLRDRNFVTLLVNYSPEQKNEAFLGQFPKIKGYPHFFVLDASGKLLHSQDTGELEDGKGYSREKMAAFLKAWGRKGTGR